MENSELKKCPVCGGSADIKKSDYIVSEPYFIECRICGLRTREYKGEDDAAEAWNLRK